MRLRDGPQLVEKTLPIGNKISTAPAPIDTGINSTVKPLKLIASPPRKTAKKPPNVKGYSWRSDSSGFALRKTLYVVNGDTGIRKRRLQRIGHLSNSAFTEMKKRHRGAALERAIQNWIAEHDN